MSRILVVDDEPNICELLRLYLEKDGYTVDTAPNGAKALELYAKNTPDLIILDLMMPVMDGWETCRRVRELGSCPVIMLTAKGETFDKVSGLELGADDYVVKPFDTKEVVARVKAVLRRTEKPEDKQQEISYDKLTVNLTSYELTVDGKKVDAPPKEMELLYFLASNPNKVFTRDQLLDKVWGFEYFGDSRTIDVHIKRIREKLSGVSDRWELKTIWSVGYKFEVR